MLRSVSLVVVVALALAAPAVGQEPISLIDAGKSAGGLTLGNAPEFPSAKCFE